MPLLDIPRSRTFIAFTVLSCAVTLGVVISHHITQVQAAKRAVLAEDASVFAELAAGATPHPGANPVIVELFTSEGCSSCPPADALLAHLQRDQPVPSANIIALEEHVDYWDHLGWRDPFSSPYITERQRSYQAVFGLGDVFTPQFVVNGSAQFNGTDPSAVETAIARASANTVSLQLTSVQVRMGGSPIEVSAAVANAPATHSEYVRPYAALVDPQVTTDVHAGENNGRTLQHINAVRAFERNGESWHMKGLGTAPFRLPLPAKSNPVGMRLVVFVQTKPFGPILGAASCSITPQNLDRPSATPPSSAADACPALPGTPSQ